MREPAPAKAGRFSRHNNCRRILRAGGIARCTDAQIIQHGAHGLFGKRRIAQAVAGALETDDKTIAHKLVSSRTP